jgi:hypothetical protein
MSFANYPFIRRLLDGPADVELSPREMALLEACLRQPVSFATIQREKKATGHSPTEEAWNKLRLIRDFNRGLQRRAAPAPAAAPSNNHSVALLRVYTNGIVDDRIEKAVRLLADDNLTVNEKLTEIDDLIRFPATASAEQLGELLGVTKQAVLKSDWWKQNRQGERGSEIGRRRAVHKARAKDYEAPAADRGEN